MDDALQLFQTAFETAAQSQRRAGRAPSVDGHHKAFAAFLLLQLVVAAVYVVLNRLIAVTLGFGLVIKDLVLHLTVGRGQREKPHPVVLPERVAGVPVHTPTERCPLAQPVRGLPLCLTKATENQPAGDGFRWLCWNAGRGWRELFVTGNQASDGLGRGETKPRASQSSDAVIVGSDLAELDHPGSAHTQYGEQVPGLPGLGLHGGGAEQHLTARTAAQLQLPQQLEQQVRRVELALHGTPAPRCVGLIQQHQVPRGRSQDHFTVVWQARPLPAQQ